MARTRILLADDHEEVLETVTRLLAGEFEVVAAVENGQQAIKAVAELDPDILLLDISMPILNGFQTASRLKDSGSRVKVIFLSAYQDPDFIAGAFSLGALGYVLKHRLTNDLVPAIRRAVQNQAVPAT